MSAFWSKKREIPENVTQEERIRKIESRLNLLSAEILDVATAQTIIRDKVLRKIQQKKTPDLEMGDDKPKDYYGGMLLPDK